MRQSHVGLWLALAATVALAACGKTASLTADVSAHPDPLAALASSDPTLAAHKRLVFDLWRSVVNAGQVERADVPLPEEGGPQPVKGATGAAQVALLESAQPHLARNKRLAFDLWRTVVDAGQGKLAGRFVDASFIEHNPNGASGLKGFRTHFPARADVPVQPWILVPVVAIVAEGDLVVLVTMREHPHPTRVGRTYTTTWFNMFRIVDDRVIEHWNAATRT
jgi:predicted SnoaL-like aldol condensation-catalyzing enzyme